MSLDSHKSLAPQMIDLPPELMSQVEAELRRMSSAPNLTPRRRKSLAKLAADFSKTKAELEKYQDILGTKQLG